MKFRRILKKPHLEQAIWIFPLIALGISAWLLFQFFYERGELIEIQFSDASSLEPEKTPVKFRGLEVGQVQNIKLSSSHDKVLVYVRLHREANFLAREGSQFWIVQPEVGFQGVRGLETLIRGTYIRVEPGSKEAPKQQQFLGQVGVDMSEASQSTVSYTLVAPRAEPINPGDSVTYRGLKVGVVSEVSLDKNAQGVEIKINVETKYVRLIRNNSQFWKKKAVKADLGLFGSKVEIGSFETLMRGGITFATPAPPEKIANAQSRFSLQEDPPKDWQKWSPNL